jgi:hypothetical protein
MAKINKKQFPDIPKCVYAGDEADEYCSQCNGVTMIVDGEEFSCKECQSYTEPKPVNKEQPVPPSESHETPRDANEKEQAYIYTPQSITTSIKAESGLSVETKKGWYRFTYSEERIVPETADIDKERELLWNDVNREVDRQAEEIQIMLKN